MVPGSSIQLQPKYSCIAFSGGGFSNFFPVPSYQVEAVTNFLTNHPPPFTAAQFNNSGKVRGIPDLSANGFVNYLVLRFIIANKPPIAQIMSLGDYYHLVNMSKVSHLSALGSMENLRSYSAHHARLLLLDL